MQIDAGLLSQLIMIFNKQVQEASAILNNLLQLQAKQSEVPAPAPVKAKASNSKKLLAKVIPIEKNK